MVEHAAVNRRVVSSSLTRGAKETPIFSGFFVLNNLASNIQILIIPVKTLNLIFFSFFILKNLYLCYSHNYIERGRND